MHVQSESVRSILKDLPDSFSGRPIPRLIRSPKNGPEYRFDEKSQTYINTKDPKDVLAGRVFAAIMYGIDVWGYEGDEWFNPSNSDTHH